MIKLSQMVIDTKNTLKTDKFLLVSTSNAYEYVNNEKSAVNGIKCEVLVPALGYEKISVKVPLSAKIDVEADIPENTYIQFVNLQIKLYQRQGGFGISASADDVQFCKQQ